LKAPAVTFAKINKRQLQMLIEQAIWGTIKSCLHLQLTIKDSSKRATEKT